MPSKRKAAAAAKQVSGSDDEGYRKKRDRNNQVSGNVGKIFMVSYFKLIFFLSLILGREKKPCQIKATYPRNPVACPRFESEK